MAGKSDSLIGPIQKTKNNSILENSAVSIMNEDGSQIDLKPSLLFCEDEAGKNYIKNSSKNNSKSELKKYLKLPIQTSYYGSSFDRKSNKYDFKKDEIGKRGDVLTNLGPDDQMAEYLKIFNVNWGIFTDGAIWRLYRKEASASYSQKFYEFDFSELYNLYRTSGEDQAKEHSEFFEIAKYMFWFFSFDGLIKGTSVIPFIESVYQKSQVYVENIEEDLKERFVHAMTISCNGYLESVNDKGHDVDLKLIAKTSESLIFNLIFIRSCESKRVLPVHQDYVHVSLKALVDKLRHFSYLNEFDASASIVKQRLKDIFNKEVKDDGYDIYEYVQRLHLMVEEGNNGFGITSFVESVFYPDEEIFYKKYKISNKEMIKLVYQLFFNFNSGKNVQIPYNLITPRQLGSVYESFLEFQPEFAKEKMFYLKRKNKGNVFWQWVSSKKNKESRTEVSFAVEKGGIIFSANNSDKKTTGTYYTPSNVVNFMVKESVDELVRRIGIKNLLSIKICDPAMGSGHFLLGALDYVSKRFAEIRPSENMGELKRLILDSCIFGYDLNPSAVKLTKMSLWLETAMPGKKLERLSDQLFCEDTLTIKPKGKSHGFDLIIGNPPYVKIQNLNDETSKYLFDNYVTVDGKSDLYYAFIEQSVYLTKKDGLVSLINPSQWMFTGAGEKLRTFFAKGHLRKIFNMDRLQVFEGATTYPCVMFLEKGYEGAIEYQRINEFSKTSPISISNNFNVINRAHLNKGSWSFDGSLEDINWEELCLEKFYKLKEICKPNYGIITGFDEAFVVGKVESLMFEKELLVPYAARGVELEPLSVAAESSFLIFPYEISNGGFKLIPESKLKKNFPKCYKHFLAHRSSLKSRKSGRKYYAEGEDWYKFYYIWDYEYFEKEKLIYRAITKNFTVGQLNKKKFAGSNYPTIALNIKNPKEKSFYLGILNSSVVNNYLRTITQPLQGDARKFNPSNIGSLLVPKFDSTNMTHLRLVDFVLSCKGELGDKQKTELNALVLKIYKE